MNETYQNRITDQICKIQNDRALIAFYDRLRYAPLGSYAQLHAKGEYQENGHKVHSLICITIQDYSNGTGDRNIITRFNLAPEQIQFLLTRITSGFQEFEWSQSKIYGNPDQNGYSTAQMFYISRHPYDSKGQPMKSPWKIQIVNGKGIKAQNKNGGSYMQPRSFQSEKTTAIQLTDMDLFTLLKRTDSYISNWETVIAASLINNGKRMLADQQNSQMQQTAQAPPYCHFQNTYVHKLHPTADFLFKSTKSTSHHGYGLYSIQKTVAKYDGICKISTDHEVFDLKILLYLTKLTSS